MDLHCPLAEFERPRNFFVRLAAHDKLKHLTLPRAQILKQAMHRHRFSSDRTAFGTIANGEAFCLRNKRRHINAPTSDATQGRHKGRDPAVLHNHAIGASLECDNHITTSSARANHEDRCAREAFSERPNLSIAIVFKQRRSEQDQMCRTFTEAAHRLVKGIRLDDSASPESLLQDAFQSGSKEFVGVREKDGLSLRRQWRLPGCKFGCLSGDQLMLPEHAFLKSYGSAAKLKK
jgi:hypothetical protein